MSSPVCKRCTTFRVANEGELCSLCAAKLQERNRLVEVFTAAAVTGLSANVNADSSNSMCTVDWIAHNAVEIGQACAARIEAAKEKP